MVGVWLRVGECNKCGDCCRKDTLKIRIKIYEAVGIPYKIVNLDCGNFDDKTGLCKDYANRPESCRLFPQNPFDLAALSRCGYRFVSFEKGSCLNNEP